MLNKIKIVHSHCLLQCYMMDLSPDVFFLKPIQQSLTLFNYQTGQVQHQAQAFLMPIIIPT